jgi:nucleotide-binding universal stress UspA family protein
MMFERILVPLDGSRLAEAILPVAQALAQRLASTLVLVHVLERDAAERVHGERHLTQAADAQAYLQREGDACRALGVPAEAHLDVRETRDVASAIDALARAHHTGLIAMSAHGRQTLRDRLIGPIAQRALRDGSTPVLLRTAGSTPDEALALRQILVPIDFRHTLTQALEVAATLGQAFDAAVTLLHVAERPDPLRARLLPGSSAMLGGLEQRRARRRLHALATQLCESGLRAEAVSAKGAAENAILDESRRRGVDLIVLVTHGRVGLTAWYEHSIMQHVIAQPKLTVLLLRDAQAGATPYVHDPKAGADEDTTRKAGR